jgi:hypothetical protein
MNNAKKAAIVLAATGAAIGATTGTASAAGGHGMGGATAQGAAVKSPGLISGNVAQAPIDVPIQLTGNSVNVGGILNPVFGNTGVVH